MHNPTRFSSATVGEVLKLLFPDGTRPGKSKSLERIPLIPTDLFAAAAYLIDRGDVYRSIAPHGPGRMPGPIHLSFTQAERDHWILLGKAFRENISVVPQARGYLRKISPFWKTLWQAKDEPLNLPRTPNRAPSWWHAALALLVIADEACADLGFAADKKYWLEVFLRGPVFQASGATAPIGKGSQHQRYKSAADTLCLLVNPHVVRVLPKSRTPAVGCTMRALSHNLCLLPPRGSVDLNWFHAPGKAEKDGEPLNILAIPFPFSVPAWSFHPSPRPVPASSGTSSATPFEWGWFDVDQPWLTKSDCTSNEAATAPTVLAEFVIALIEASENDTGQIHGVILPELAVDWDTHDAIVRAICSRARSIEFLITGSSSDCQNNLGNFVLTTTFHDQVGEPERRAITYSREKHHRWRLDRSQICEYGLASALDPHKLWWEGNDVAARQVGLTVFRQGSVFSAMICEDLARSEPCHSPLRSVGPNLVFVLLMDGPQIAQRWSSRYATTLADDPGSSVLTLTSLGLIERANAMGRRKPERAIALWKDDVSGIISLNCPTGAHGLVITLSGQNVTEATLDGRVNTDSHAWRYHGHQPVALEKGHKFSWITG